MKKFYPAFLDLNNKECLVVGGGPIALHKTKALLKCGARVTIVAPRLAPGFSHLKDVSCRKRPFHAIDLSGRPWLVVAGTDDEALNERIYRLCVQRRLWVNVVDRPAFCGFILPAVVRRGLLTFAISTGGASPALAKFVGTRVKEAFGPEYAALARILHQMRPRLMNWPMDRRRVLLEQFLTPALLRKIRKEGLEKATKSLLNKLKSPPHGNS